jgi:membrane-bound lytic murein transglycosylase A
MRRLLTLLPILSITACVPQAPSSPLQSLPGAPPGQITSLSSLPGWSQDDPTAALKAFVLGCKAILQMPADTDLGGSGLAQSAGGQAGLWQTACTAAKAITPNDTMAARYFFETDFTAYALPDQALITGYFEPEYPGAKNPGPGYTVPLYAKPADPDLAALPRAAIDNGALTRKSPVTAYLSNPVDAFMLQIQGSGRILLANGKTLRVGFDGQNGQPYTPIGRLLVQQGDIAADQVSFQSISSWLKANPGQAQAIMEQNANYVFLHPLGPLPDDEGAPGALGVPLTAGRSLAVDKSIIPLGTPVFVATTDPVTNSPLTRLTIAQDTGGGITGATKADLFFGAGPDAETTAGIMREPGQLYVLLPNPAPAAPASPGS